MELVDLLNSGPPTIDDHYRYLAASESPYNSQVGKMMLELLDRLRRDVIGPRLYVTMIREEIWLQYSDGHGHRTLIKATIDHKDYSPLVEGVPLLHYRLSCARPATAPHDSMQNVELRTRNAGTACEFVLDAIKACKDPA